VVHFTPRAALFCHASKRGGCFLGFSGTFTTGNFIMKRTTKHIKIQLSGDADAVQAAIALLNHLNFINGSLWSNAIRKRGEASTVRFASRPIEVDDQWIDDSIGDC
jgi:hypothetical protein